MLKLRTLLLNHRRSPFIRYVTKKCWRFIECVEGKDNWDFDGNGERHLIEALSSAELTRIFDVGANVGEWAVIAHEIFPEAQLHCFEVLPSTANELKATISEFPRIKANAFGLSDVEGEVSLKTFENISGLTSLLDVDHPVASSRASGRVMTGDCYCKENQVDHIDLLKIDTEGSEHLVIMGFEGMLRDQRIDVIQFEYGFGSMLTKFMLRDFCSLLTGYGYQVGKLYPTYVEFRDYEVRHENFFGSNMVAVLRSHSDLIERLS